VALFTTAGTALRLPPGVLHSGFRYFIELQALQMPGSDFNTRPYVETLPRAVAPALSGLLEP
jgi:hypothetical protein